MRERDAYGCGTQRVSRAMTESPSSVSGRGAAVSAGRDTGPASTLGGGGGSRSPQAGTNAVTAAANTRRRTGSGNRIMHPLSDPGGRGASTR